MNRIRKIMPSAVATHLMLWGSGSGLAQAQRATGPMHSPLDGALWHWGIMILHVLFWVLVFVVLLLAIRWLIQNTGGRKEQNDHSKRKSLEILEERYARGEIDREEFEQMKRDLSP